MAGTKQTPLQVKLDNFGKKLGIIIMIICKYYDLKYEEINEFWKKKRKFIFNNFAYEKF